MLIFMVTVLFSTLLSLRSSLPVYVPLLILAAAAMFSGLLSGITRLRRENPGEGWKCPDVKSPAQKINIELPVVGD